MSDGHTVIPSWLTSVIDRQLPTLSDTELRVLLVVVRQTLGRGKERDWLARSQIVSRTGRSPASVSRAVEALIQKRLIVAEDGSGQSCSTPQSRRALQSRLYFRCGEALYLARTTLSEDTHRSLRVKSSDTTETTILNSVVLHHDTLSVKPFWLALSEQPTQEQSERIAQEKNKIRETLRRKR